MASERNAGLEALLQYLKTSRGFDFTGYKRSTLTRRVLKRMAALKKIKTYENYQDYLEVHQRIPADQQIEPRDRRVLNEIEATEDHRAAKLAFHHELVGVRVIEILRSQLCRHGRDRFSVVDAMPRMGERIGIDIGGVDFHAFAKTLFA